jgi:formylglycine-generating enzyme required for sulfatase activity
MAKNLKHCRAWIVFLAVALLGTIVFTAVRLGRGGLFSLGSALPGGEAGEAEVTSQGQPLPSDLVAVGDAQYASLDGLMAGSQEAQVRQRQTAEEMALPLEIMTRKTGIVFRLVPAGSFTMGTSGREHRVTLSKAFYCGKYEVTQAQWKQVMGGNPSTFKLWGEEHQPVEQVSWGDCQFFLRRLCDIEGVPSGTYRLLTEGEWEYACRAGTQTMLYNSDSLVDGDYPWPWNRHCPELGKIAWYADNSKGSGLGGNPPSDYYIVTLLMPHSVGELLPNAFGLYDMIGNVCEWCEDRFGEYSTTPDSVTVIDPVGPTLGRERVLRGGSWHSQDELCRSGSRSSGDPHRSFQEWGLRLARTISPAVGQEPPTADRASGVAPRVARQKWVVPDLGMEMVHVEPGSFQMGSWGGYDEKPVHEVQITRAFWMGKCEVTQGQYQAVIGTNPSAFKGATLPVENVSWNDAVAFCRKLTDREQQAGRLPAGYVYRLPTEAEWEYAARGGNQSRGFKYGGSDTPDEFAWYNRNSGKRTHPVGRKKANELGLYDMSGNVWEWCHDYYDGQYYAKSPSSDPTGPSTARGRVVRGGCWYHGLRSLSVAKRAGEAPGDRSNIWGFRVALSLPLD